MEVSLVIRTTLPLLVAGLVLSGCGTTAGERAVTGAGIGAAGGAVVGALVGAPLVGAAIGGSVGAATGALTTNSNVDLGKPVWKQ
jgi:osmotically inducible lipoprotein OsmB